MFPDEVVDSSMMLQLFFFVCERYSSASERIIKYQETINWKIVLYWSKPSLHYDENFLRFDICRLRDTFV